MVCAPSSEKAAHFTRRSHRKQSLCASLGQHNPLVRQILARLGACRLDAFFPCYFWTCPLALEAGKGSELQANSAWHFSAQCLHSVGLERSLVHLCTSMLLEPWSPGLLLAHPAPARCCRLSGCGPAREVGAEEPVRVGTTGGQLQGVLAPVRQAPRCRNGRSGQPTVSSSSASSQDRTGG